VEQITEIGTTSAYSFSTLGFYKRLRNHFNNLYSSKSGAKNCWNLKIKLIQNSKELLPLKHLKKWGRRT
jgi:hypothetical protein